MAKIPPNQYDGIASNYVEGKEGFPFELGFATPAVLKHVGRVRGKVVYDLACGGGHFTRMFAVRGALKVHGIDISKEMIRQAKRRMQRPEIEYHCGDVAKFDFSTIREKADVLAATFLLHYGDSPAKIRSPIENPGQNLKKRGRFVAIIPNPEVPISSDGNRRAYSPEGKNEAQLKPGDVIKAESIYGSKLKPVAFNFYWWPKKVYEECFRQAGFEHITWHKLSPTRQAIAKMGENFWRRVMKNPHFTVITAVKK